MQKRCTVDLWTAGYAGSRLTASARSPMDKPWTTLCVAHRLPTGRRLPTSSTVLKPIVIKSGKVKTKTPAPALAYSSPVAVQTTGTTADAVFQAAEFKSRIRYPLDKKLPSLVGQFRKCIADYLWDATQNGHIVAALLGHANDQHPFGPASAWTISDWSGEIRPLIQTYLTDRQWEVQESPLGKFKLANRLPKFSAAGLQTVIPPANEGHQK